MLSYKWNPQISYYQKSDRCLFINPYSNSFFKVKSPVKGLLDNIIDNQILKKNLSEVEMKLVEYFEDKGVIKDVSKSSRCNHDNNHSVMNSVYLLVTRQCNMTCSFCCVGSNPNFIENDILNLEQIKEVIDDLKQFKVKRFIITGGEPFVRKDIIEIINYIYNNLETEIIISSNGLLLNEGNIADIRGKVKRIDISLENIYESEPQKEKLYKIIEKIKEHGLSLGFSFVVTNKNKNNIYDFIDKCIKYNAIPSIKLVSYIPNGVEYSDLILDRKESIDMYISMFKYIIEKKYDNSILYGLIFPQLMPKASCSAANNSMMCIYPNGDVYSCHTLCEKNFLNGNILTDKAKIIYENQRNNKNNDDYNIFSIDNRKICQTCNIKYFCQGDCGAELYYDIHKKDSMPVLCDFRKVLIEYMLWDFSDQVPFLHHVDNVVNRLMEIGE